MPLEIALLGYAGMALLGRLRWHPRRGEADVATIPKPVVAQPAGAALLLFALVEAFSSYGPYQAVVAWLGLLSLSAIVLVVLMSRWPRIAIALWLPCLVAWMLIQLVKP